MWGGVAYAKGDAITGLSVDDVIGLVARGWATDIDGVLTVGGGVLTPASNAVKDNYQHTVTVTGTDQLLSTLIVSAPSILSDTVFEIWSLWSCTNSATAKNFKILLNGTAVFDLSQTTIQSIESIRQIRCRGAGNQVATNRTTATPIGVTSSTGVLTLTIDLSAGAVFQFVGNRANAGDSLALEACCVKVL